MPQQLSPDGFSLTIERGSPVVTLHDVAVSGGVGWSFLNRATLLVVDGPGDEGFLLARMTAPDVDAAPTGRDTAVASAGSVTVVVPGGRFSARVLD